MKKAEHKIRSRRIAVTAIILAVLCAVSIVPNAGRERHVILILKVIDDTNSFWSSLVGGAKMAAAEYGVRLTVMGPKSEAEYEEQGEMIKNAVEMKPDVIALVPSEYQETQKYARKIEEAGIRLLLVDSFMEQKMGSCLVATDNFQAGWKMGNYARERFGEDMCIGIVGHIRESSTAKERERGIREGLGDKEDRIEDIVYSDSDYTKAYDVTKQMLVYNPQINVVFGLNEYSSVGAFRAIRSLGLTDKVRLIGFDSSIREVRQLEMGTIDALLVQKPLNMGYLCIEQAVKLMEGEEVPQYIDSGSVLITKETMYTEENQKLLFPF